VRVSDDFFWAKGAIGTTSAPPDAVTNLSEEWDRGLTRTEKSALGEHTPFVAPSLVSYVFSAERFSSDERVDWCGLTTRKSPILRHKKLYAVVVELLFTCLISWCSAGPNLLKDLVADVFES
jgi:hypothetical protein